MIYIFILTLAYLNVLLSGLLRCFQGNGNDKSFKKDYKIYPQHPTAKKIICMYELYLLDADEENTSHEVLGENYAFYVGSRR